MGKGCVPASREESRESTHNLEMVAKLRVILAEHDIHKIDEMKSVLLCLRLLPGLKRKG